MPAYSKPAFAPNGESADAYSLSDHLLTFISQALDIKFSSSQKLVAASIGCNFVSFVTSLSIASKSTLSPILRWSNVAATCGSLVLQILSLVTDKYKLSLNLDIVNNIKKVILDYFVNDDGNFRINADFSIEYLLKYGVGIISFLLACCMKATGLSLVQMSAFLRTQQGLKHTATDIKAVIMDALEALNIYTDNTNAAFTKQIEDLVNRGKDMLSTNAAELILDSAKYAQMQSIMKDILAFQNSKLNDEQNKIFGHSKGLLNSIYIKLMDKQKSVLEISNPEDRVVCTGFLLEGQAGIGKSTAAKHILRRVATAMGWSTSIYDISRGDNGNYNQIYFQQDLGIGNEFGGAREDGMVRQINSIISGDPCNLEAAHVDFKHQRCNLKLVALTSNRTEYSFSPQITEQMNVAMMTRLIRINIEDPQFQGRGQPNLHRRDGDFSHLEFSIWHMTNTTPRHMTDTVKGYWEKVTLDQLLLRLTQRCAKESASWVRRLLAENDALTDELRESLNTRLKQFDKIYHTTDWSAMPNAGQNFFSIRWQGQPGTGKTQQLREIAAFIHENFKLPVATWDSKESLLQPHTTPTVFILDDYDIPHNEKAILDACNRAPKNSIFLVSTHHEAPIRRESILSTVFILSLISVFLSDLFMFNGYRWQPNWRYMWTNLKRVWTNRRYYHDFTVKPDLCYTESGLYRRLGASGLIKTPYGLDDLGTSNSILITRTKNGVRINTTDSGDLKEYIVNKYTSFLKEVGELVIKYNQPPPHIIPDVRLCVKDVKSFLKAYNSSLDLPLMVNRTSNPHGYVQLSDQTMLSIVESSGVSTWLQPREYASIDELVVGLAYTVNSLSRPLTCLATTPGKMYTYSSGTLYVNNTVETENITECNGYLYYSRQLVPLEFMRFVVHGSDGINYLCGFNVLEAITISQYIKQHLYDENLALYRSMHEKETIFRKSILFHKNHPFLAWCTSSQGGKVFLALGGALLGLTGVILGTKKLIQMFTHTTGNPNAIAISPSVTSNRSGNKRQDDYRRENDEYFQGLEQGKWSNRQHYRDVLISRGGYDAAAVSGWERQIGNYRQKNAQNTMTRKELIHGIVDNISRENIPRAEDYFKQLQDKEDIDFDTILEIFRSRPNAVSRQHELSTLPSVMDPIIKICRKALVTVHSRMNCYGLLIGGNKVVTVNHAIDDISIEIGISEGETRLFYSAKLVTRSITKDLAILEIIDPTFTSKKSLEKFLPDCSTRTDWNQRCFYVRPLEQTLVVAGTGNYIAGGRTPGRDCDADIYCPTDYVKFDSFTMTQVSHIYKPGDCGMPLIAISENKCYIVGIHNAYNDAGTAWFSPLFKEELYGNAIDLAKINAVDTIPLTVVKPMQELGMVSIPDYNPWVETAKGNPWTNHPEIPVIGYTKDLHYYSRPKTTKQKMRSPLCKLDTTVCPTPTQISDLTPQAREFLPKNDLGIPLPLLAQTKKMFNAAPFSADPELFSIAKEIVKDEFHINYGRTHPIRMHEVINGMMSGPLRRLNLATSCGPYLKKKYGLVDKKKLFHDTNKNDPTKPYILTFTNTPASIETREQYDKIVNLWEHGTPIAIFVKDNPKVEMASQEEVEREGKIRLFCEMDLAVNMAFKRYFGSLMNEMMLHHSTSSCKVGFNPYKLPTYLFKYIPLEYESFSSDLKRMDKQLCNELLLAFGEIAASTTDDETHKTAIMTAIKSLTITVHMQSGVLYYVFGGNPSGIYITTIMNTTIRELGCVYLYVKQMYRYLEKPFLCSYACYSQAQVSARLGDDEFCAYDPASNMNFEESRIVWKEFGLELVKSKNSSLDDFCSRELERSKDGVIYPKLKKQSILASLYWVDRQNMTDIGLAFTNVLFEASLWDEAFFNDVKHDVMVQIKHLNVPPHKVFIPNYRQQRTHFAKYVLGYEKSPMYLVSPEVAETYLGIDVDIKTPHDDHIDYCRLYLMSTDPRHGDGLKIEYDYSQTLTAWTATIRHRGLRGIGTHARKNIAKQIAFQDLIAARDAQDNLQGSSVPAST